MDIRNLLAGLASLWKVNVWTALQIAKPYALSSTVAWDGAHFQHLSVTVNGGAFTIANPTSHKAGALYLVNVAYTTSHSISWGNQFKGLSSVSPTATAGAEDNFLFRSNGTNLVLVGYALNGGA